MLGLLAWGTIVGLDLVSMPQMMIARPLVAGTIAGGIAGDPMAGMVVGAILELFALDVLPVGAARYPDYGPATVAATAAAAGAPGVFGYGVAVAIGLVTAYAGEHALAYVRRRNSDNVRRFEARLDAGQANAVTAVHLRGITWDAGRAALLTGLGLSLAMLVRAWPPVGLRGSVLLTAVTIGAALSAGTVGVLRLAGRGLDLRWFGIGILAGTGWLVLT